MKDIIFSIFYFISCLLFILFLICLIASQIRTNWTEVIINIAFEKKSLWIVKCYIIFTQNLLKKRFRSVANFYDYTFNNLKNVTVYERFSNKMFGLINFFFREKMNDEFSKQIASIFNQWESDIQKSKDSEDKLEVIFL